MEYDIKLPFDAPLFSVDILRLCDIAIVAFCTGSTAEPRESVANGSPVATVVNLSLLEVTAEAEDLVSALNVPDSPSFVVVAVSAVTYMVADILGIAPCRERDLPSVEAVMASGVLSVALTTTPIGIGIVVTPPPGDSPSKPRSPSEMTTLEIVAASPHCIIVCDPTITVFPPGAAERLATVPKLDKSLWRLMECSNLETAPHGLHRQYVDLLESSRRRAFAIGDPTMARSVI